MNDEPIEHEPDSFVNNKVYGAYQKPEYVEWYEDDYRQRYNDFKADYYNDLGL